MIISFTKLQLLGDTILCFCELPNITMKYNSLNNYSVHDFDLVSYHAQVILVSEVKNPGVWITSDLNPIKC